MPYPDVIDYAKKAVFISSGDYNSSQASGDLLQLSRVQNVSWAFNMPIQNEVYLDAGNETVMAEKPTVTCALNWYATNGYNEKGVGLVTNGITGAFVRLNDQKNLYVATNLNPGQDIIGSTMSNQTKSVIGVGQVVLSSYSINATNGGFIEANATLEGLNAALYSGASGQANPAVSTNGSLIGTYPFTLPIASQQYDSFTGVNQAALSASDIIMEFPVGSPIGMALGPRDRQCHVQSFNASFNINRQAFKGLGEAYPSNRPVVYPIDVSLSVEALVSQYQAARLNDLGCYTTTGQQVDIMVLSTCQSKQDLIPIQLSFMGLQLQSQESNVSTASFETATFNWTLTITDPHSASKNVFMKEFSFLELLSAYQDGEYYPFETDEGDTLRAQQ